MLKTPFKKLLSLMLTVAMVVSFFPATVMADESGASDLEGHWASEVMTEWIGYGIIAGYEDGTVRPDKSITRAEMTAMLDRVMGYQTMAANHFSDLDDNWYTEVILKGNAAGVISGYEDGTVRPNATISRQEATAMIARVLALDTENVPEADFTDSDTVADWAKDAVNAMAAKGYVNGSDGQFRPTAGMTRAEVVTILNNIFDKLYDENVTYISDSNGSAVINADDVTLKNLTVSGDLIVAQGVGDGHVVLDGVTVEGRLIVRGGGENSVIIRGDSKIGSVSIERIDGAVRVAVEGGASVSMISVADGSDTVTLQGNIGSLNIDNNNADVVVNGTVDDLNVLGQNATVEINGSVETLAVEGTNADLTIGGELTTVDIAAGASEASITIQRDGSVGTLTTAAEKTTVTAQGDVTTVTVEETAADAEINIQSTSSVQNLTTSAQNTTVNVAGTVESISVNNGANNATITVDEDATASTITTDAANTTINGDGSVENVTVDENATGATVTTPGTSVENNSDEVVIVGEDETIGAGTTGTTPGGTTPTPTPDPTPTPQPTYYTVTFQKVDNTAISTQSVRENSTATAPADDAENMPTVTEGNKLTWYNGTEPYDFETPVTGNLTLTAVIGSDDFQAGNGTEAYPYLISTAEQFVNVAKLADVNNHFQLMNNIDMTSTAASAADGYGDTGDIYQLYGELDGAGYTITAKETTSGTILYATNAVIENVTFAISDHPAVRNATNTTFNNVTVTGNMEVANNCGAFVTYATPENSKVALTFNNCVANVRMLGGGGSNNYNAVFVGYAYGNGAETNLTFNNCVNEGALICGKAAMFLGNNSANKGYVTINVTDSTNNGYLRAAYADYKWDPFVATGANANNVVTINGQQPNSEDLTEGLQGENGTFDIAPLDPKVSLTVNEDQTFKITPLETGGFEDVDHYVVTMAYYAKLLNADGALEGGTQIVSVSETIPVGDSVQIEATKLKKLQFVDEAWVKSNASEIEPTSEEGIDKLVYTVDGIAYYYIGDNADTNASLEGNAVTPTMISVSAYNAEGEVLRAVGLTTN